MGILLFWLQYIIAAVLLYNILRCIRIGTKNYVTGKSPYELKKEIIKSNDDKRLKHPLWLIILLCVVLFIPVVNILIYLVYLSNVTNREEYYLRSFLTIKY